jgi:hypothetical protein
MMTKKQLLYEMKQLKELLPLKTPEDVKKLVCGAVIANSLLHLLSMLSALDRHKEFDAWSNLTRLYLKKGGWKTRDDVPHLRFLLSCLCGAPENPLLRESLARYKNNPGLAARNAVLDFYKLIMVNDRLAALKIYFQRLEKLEHPLFDLTARYCTSDKHPRDLPEIRADFRKHLSKINAADKPLDALPVYHFYFDKLLGVNSPRMVFKAIYFGF